MIEFGEKLKRLREEKGMTQQTLAEQLYVTRQAVSRWECGARYPDLLMAKKIAEVLETTIDELVSGEECRRDVEKEPVLATSKYRVAQIVLYAIGLIPFLLMCLFSVKSFFPSESLRGTPAGQVTVVTIVALLEYVMKMIAMGTGLCLAVRNELTPFKIGMVMSIPFWVEAVVLGTQYSNELVKGNETIGFFWPDVVWLLVVAVCIICFFAGKLSKSRAFSYLIPFFIYFFGIYKAFVLVQSIRMLLLNYTELGYVVRTVRIVGKVAFIALLVLQTYVLSRKRRIVEIAKG